MVFGNFCKGAPDFMRAVFLLSEENFTVAFPRVKPLVNVVVCRAELLPGSECVLGFSANIHGLLRRGF